MKSAWDKFKNGGRGRRVNKGERQSDFGVAGGYMLPRHYGWLFYRNPFFGKTLCVVYDRTFPDTEEIIFWHNEIINHIRQYGYLQDYPLLERRS